MRVCVEGCGFNERGTVAWGRMGDIWEDCMGCVPDAGSPTHL